MGQNLRILLDGSNFIGQLLTNMSNFVVSAGSYIVILIGVSLIIMSVLQITRGLASRGSRANWLIVIGGLLIGGVLAAGGWKGITNTSSFGSLGKGTFDELTKGITPGGIADVSDGSTTDTIGYLQKSLHVLSDTFMSPFGKMLTVAAGVGLIVVSCWQLAKFFMSGRTSEPWLKILAMFIIGSCLYGSGVSDDGWKWLRDFAVSGTKEAVESIAGGSTGTDIADGLKVNSLNESSDTP